MKNATEQAKALDDLLASLPEGVAPEFAEARDPAAVLVLSFLMWEATTDQALKAYAKLRERVVDFNDLRMNMAHETIEIIGKNYPMALDRARRLRAALRHIYNRQHEVSLEAVGEMGRREARKYVESLDGIVPYVSARVLLLSFGAHAMPADERLCSALLDAGVIDEEADDDGDAASLSAWLTRQIKSADGVEAHFKLQAYADEHGGSGRRRSSSKKKTKTTTKRKKKSAASGSRNSKKTGGSTKKKTTTKRKKKSAARKTKA